MSKVGVGGPTWVGVREVRRPVCACACLLRSPGGTYRTLRPALLPCCLGGGGPRLAQGSCPPAAPAVVGVTWGAPAGRLYSRVSLNLLGPLSAWWLPAYARVDVELSLTPVAADAGADLVLCYPAAGEPPLQLASAGDVPAGWPDPRACRGRASPFSLGARDYVRPVGPGVYVGCGYRSREGEGVRAGSPASYVETDAVWFLLVRRHAAGAHPAQRRPP